MAHAIWSGSINFGLVMIPVKLHTAVRDHSPHFHMLHAADQGRIHNVRRCEVCGKEVEWKSLVRGFEFEKGRYVTLSDEDLARANVRATQSVDIVSFVERSQIDLMLYDTPYYLEPEKKGRHAYALLRDALAESGKAGIAKVVLRTREHPAVLEPHGDALVLELMHFADEIVDARGLEIPHTEKPSASEMKAARMLIDTMAVDTFDPTQLEDTYTEDVMKLIEARAHHQPLPKGKAKPAPPSTVVDLMAVLQKSLEGAAKKKAGPALAKARHARAHGHAHAHAHGHGHQTKAS